MKSGKFIDCTYVALFSDLNTHIAQPKYFNLYAADVKNNACLPDRVVPHPPPPLPACISSCCCCSLGHLSRRIPQIIATLPAHTSSTRYALMCQALIGSRAARKVGRSNTPCRRPASTPNAHNANAAKLATLWHNWNTLTTLRRVCSVRRWKSTGKSAHYAATHAANVELEIEVN